MNESPRYSSDIWHDIVKCYHVSDREVVFIHLSDLKRIPDLFAELKAAYKQEGLNQDTVAKYEVAATIMLRLHDSNLWNEKRLKDKVCTLLGFKRYPIILTTK